jgi:hypothetical protein
VLLAAVVFAVALGAWELEMRHQGLTTDDLGDGRAFWAVERRKVDAGPPDPVVIVGDSRILFDTNLDVWQKHTGHRPIQLALPGQNAQPLLHDLAEDEHFRGLVVMGTAEMSYFADDAGSTPVVLEYMKTESPSQRAGHHLYVLLSRCFAFLDSDYTLFGLIERQRWPERPGVVGAYDGVWKISESSRARQTYLWDQIAKSTYLREHARRVWLNEFSGPAPTEDEVGAVVARSRADIERIRARGGDVVWVRPPSIGPLFASERVRYPRQRVWDRLVQETGSVGVHFEDYAFAQALWLPDWSHLHKSQTSVFTEGYVRVLAEHVDWLRRRIEPRGPPASLTETNEHGSSPAVAENTILPR